MRKLFISLAIVCSSILSSCGRIGPLTVPPQQETAPQKNTSILDPLIR
ncbi:MAG: periplasmic protein [Candidatus Tokpelaia sp. JSC161]|nr:MAG: periplasmic protein [Candidatus Tokpelaia sp. JSC161]